MCALWVLKDDYYDKISAHFEKILKKEELYLFEAYILLMLGTN